MLKPNIPSMRRKQTITHLLLTCLLLAASSHFHNFITITAEAIETVDFELGSKQPKSQLVMGNHLATSEKAKQAPGKKRYKAPSGPNPIGNRRPPIRP